MLKLLKSLILLALLISSAMIGLAMQISFVFPVLAVALIFRDVKSASVSGAGLQGNDIDRELLVCSALYFILPFVAFIFFYTDENFDFVNGIIGANSTFIAFVRSSGLFEAILEPKAATLLHDPKFVSVTFMHSMVLISSFIASVLMISLFSTFYSSWRARALPLDGSILRVALFFLIYVSVLSFVASGISRAVSQMSLQSYGSALIYNKQVFISGLASMLLLVWLPTVLAVGFSILEKHLMVNKNERSE